MGQNRPKLRVPQNEPELAETASVDDRHVNAPRGLLIAQVTPGPQTVSNSPRNGPESATTVSVHDRHVNAFWGSTTMEIASGPLNVE